VPMMSVPDGSSASLLQDVYAWVELDSNDVPQGAISVEVNGADPQPCEDVRSPLCDLLVCGVGLGTPGCTALGDAIPTLGSSGVMGLGITGLLLSPCPHHPALHPRRSTWGRWRTMWSTCVRRSPSR
jgi:hypothetical protein